MDQMKTTGLNFIEAVKAASTEKKIRREGCVIEIRKNLRYLELFNSSDPVLSVDDYLATDWEIVPEPPKTMGFMEAVKEMKQGKITRRTSWHNHDAMMCLSPNGKFTIIQKNDFTEFERFIKVYAGPYFVPEIGDIEATDWIVVDENEGEV